MAENSDSKDEIKICISNPKNAVCKGIILRKFFYMIFIDADGKKLYVYIATVFGGLNNFDGGGSDSLENYLPVYHDSKAQNRCCLSFEFSSNGKRGNLITSVSSEDITDSFCQQRDKATFWGKWELLNNQQEVKAKIKGIYGEKYGSRLPQVNASRPVYYIHEEGKPLHECLAAKGKFKQYEFDKGTNQYGYELSGLTDSHAVEGVESLNWIRSEISLKSDIRNRPVLFTIEFDDSSTIFTPDFTWYFAPPKDYILGENSYVTSGKDGAKMEPNAIQNLLNRTTIQFSEWMRNPETISERNKFRLLRSNAPVSDSLVLSQDKSLTICLHIINPQRASSQQFIIGLLVAFLLSFCSDKTRLNDYYSCLNAMGHCTCVHGCICQSICNALGILTPIMVLLAFLAFVLRPKACFPPNSQGDDGKYHGEYFRQIWFRRLGIFFTLVFTIYIFVLWLIFPDFMRGLISCHQNAAILAFVYSFGLLMNIIYVHYCLKKLNRDIFNYI